MSASIPEVRGAQCVRYRYRYSDCRRCADACPHEAVTLTDEGVRLDAGRCQNCALCASACRTGALAAGSLPRIDLLRRAIKQQRFSFACAPSQAQGDAVVPCLGGLDAVMLAYLAKRGISVELRGAYHCERCAHGARGGAQLALNLEGAARLAASAANEPWSEIRVIEAPDGGMAADKPSLGRRQLFRRLVGRGIDAVVATGEPADALPVPEKAIRPGPYVGTDQRELLRIVGKRPEQARMRLEAHLAIPALELELDPGCTACEACFRACPTGALAIGESQDDWLLAFDADRCVACEVCIEVCQPKVLHASPSVDISPDSPRRALHRLGKQRCARCDRFFVSPQPAEHCPVCVDDADAFEQIFG